MFYWIRKNVFSFSMGFLFLFISLALPSFAVDFPTKPITYLICFPPGGQSDVQGRIQEPFLRKILGVPIVITYKTGAGGALGWTELSKSKPDGYTIAGINIPHIILQPIGRPDAGYETENLEPIIMFDSMPIGLIVRKESQFDALESFIRFAKEKPGVITAGLSGTLSGHDITATQFQKMTGTKLTLVPFAGAAPQVAALLGGHVTCIFGNLSDMVRVKDLIRVLAMGTEARHPLFPDVPTFKEKGIPLVAGIDRGVAAPKGTPPEIIKKLHDAFLATIRDKEYLSKMKELGFDVAYRGPEETKRYIAEGIREYSKLLKEFAK